MDEKFCAKCGSHLADKAAFCTRCGSPVVVVPPKVDVAAPAKPEVSRAKKALVYTTFALGGLLILIVIIVNLAGPETPPAAPVARASAAAAVATPVPDTQPSMTGEEIIAAAPPDSLAEERAGIRAFCQAYRDRRLPSRPDAADSVEFALAVDTQIARDVDEPMDRANIVMTRVARGFSTGI